MTYLYTVSYWLLDCVQKEVAHLRTCWCVELGIGLKGWGGGLREVRLVGCAAQGISYGVTGLPTVGLSGIRGASGWGLGKWDNPGGVGWWGQSL